MASWRQDKETEEWKIFALTSEINEDGSVVVTTKAGKTTTVFISSWSKTFQTEKGEAVYGTPVSRAR
jgi:uncharacterized membrane protein